MKKLLIMGAIVCALSACQQHRTETVVECPSCMPPVRHYEVVTECSDFTDKELPDGTFTQCRHCVNKIYSDGVEVSSIGTKQVQEEKVTVTRRKVQGVKKRSCGQ